MISSMKVPRRIAMVIGNAEYVVARKLPNSRADAEAVAAKLGGSGTDKGLGFNVFMKLDANFEEMTRTYADFISAIDVARKEGRVVHAVIFYAGHGVQIADENYLVATDAKLDDESTNPIHGLFSLKDRLLQVAEKVGSTGIVIALFDACREKPFRADLIQKVSLKVAPANYPVSGGVRGFSVPVIPVARDDAPTFIAFATAPGEFAYDGYGESRHSPFTQAVCEHIADTGLEIREFYNRVQHDVRIRVAEAARTSGGVQQQVPWSESNLSDHFFFRPRSWVPVFAMSGLAWLAGIVICLVLFDGNTDLRPTSQQPLLYLTSIVFALVVAIGVWRWGSGLVQHVVFVFVATALSFCLALKVLQNKVVLEFIAASRQSRMSEVEKAIKSIDWFDLKLAALAGFMVVMIRVLQINRPTGLWRRWVVPPLSGLATIFGLWVVDRFLSLHDQQDVIVFAMLSVFSGAILGLGTTLACRPQGDVFNGFGPITGGIAAGMTMPAFFFVFAMHRSYAALLTIAPMYFALLGFQLGWCFRYFVREHKQVPSTPPAVRIRLEDAGDLAEAQPLQGQLPAPQAERLTYGEPHAEQTATPLPYPPSAYPLRSSLRGAPWVIRKIFNDPTTETSVDSRIGLGLDLLGKSPWSAICRIHARYEKDARYFLASGCITRDGAVLTAAHVLHHPSFGAAVEVIVWPGYHKNRAAPPRFDLNGSHCRICPRWTGGWFVENDYGAILLPRGTNVSVYGPPEMLELKRETWDALKLRRDATCCVIGYPGDREESGCQWQGNGRIIEHDANVVAHLCDTHEGQSGAPLMITSGGRNFVVAVHSKGFVETNNIARKLNQQFMTDYRGWIASIA